MVYSGQTFTGSASGEVLEAKFTRKSLADKDVLIRITHSGLCGTDLHAFPFGVALGHEGIGIVQELGPSCSSNFQVGDRVGWGYIHLTCGTCGLCLTGKEQYCINKQQFITSHQDQGSLGDISIRKEDWLFKIPDNLSSESAAPLMCGGATVFTPLIEHVSPTDTIGVVGIGGLGHLAIQMAAKMGCEVVVFSSSESKRDEALAMGAHHFYATKGVTDFSTLGLTRRIDKLIVTTATLPDWAAYFKLLAVNAKVIPLTIDFESKMVLPYAQLSLTGISVVGCIVAGRAMQTNMLDFCARNKVYPVIEKFPLTKEGVSEAIGKLQSGNMRYRGVLTNELA